MAVNALQLEALILAKTRRVIDIAAAALAVVREQAGSS